MRTLLHHLVAHPLLILLPELGEPLHEATVPVRPSSPVIDIVAATGLAMVVLAAPQVLAAMLLAAALRRVASLGR